MDLTPLDPYNQELIDQAHPSNWENPTPRGRYNLVAIGGGTAGIISALGTAGLGGKAALIERHLLGGDCLNYGCVPSKGLIRAARAAYQVANAAEFGVAGSLWQSPVRPSDGADATLAGWHQSPRFGRSFTSLATDVYLGDAVFTGLDSLEVGGQRLQFRNAVIATGARAYVPPIPGLNEVGFLTNETVFSLTELPRRLLVIGGGPIGCELGQAFRRFGAEVDLIEKGSTILSKEDPDAAEVVHKQFVAEGIQLHLDTSIIRAEDSSDGKCLIVETEGQEKTLVGDAILVAVGRQPNVEGLGLEATGVEFSERNGVKVNDRLQTSNPRIFAAGDICTAQKFTHAADAMARICIQMLSSLVEPR